MEAAIAGEGVPFGTHLVASDIGEGVAVHPAFRGDAAFLHHPHRNLPNPLAPVKGKAEHQPGEREARIGGLVVGKVMAPFREQKSKAAQLLLALGVGKAAGGQQAAVEHLPLLAAEKAIRQVVQSDEFGGTDAVFAALHTDGLPFRLNGEGHFVFLVHAAAPFGS